MADISQMSDDELMSIANSTQSVNPDSNSNLSSMSDDELMSIAGVQKQPSVSPTSPSEQPPKPVGNAIDAFTGGVGRGFKDAALEMGDLAADVLSNFETTKGIGSSLKGKVKEWQAGSEASPTQLASPLASSIGAGTGYTAGIMSMPGAAVRAGVGALKALPGVASVASKVPATIAGLGTQGAAGAIGGAAMDPENRGFGALTGGLVGGAAGAIGGALGSKSAELGKVVQTEVGRLKKLGIDPKSEEGLNQIRMTVRQRGLGQSLESTEAQLKQKVLNEAQGAKPESIQIPQKSASRLLTARAAKNFTKVDEERQALYKPLTESKTPTNVSSINDEVGKLSQKAKGYLPDPQISKSIKEGQATFSQLQDYRIALDGNITVAKRAVKNGAMLPKDLNQLYKTRSQVSAAMEDAATANGLSKEFKAAEDFYKHQYLPFRTLDKSGKLNKPEAIDNTMKKINTLVNSPNPNPKEIKDLVSTLGDEGRSLVGWAKIENAVQKSSVGGKINFRTLETDLQKWKVGGIESSVFQKEHKQAIAGMEAIINDAPRVMKQATNKIYIPVVGPILEHLLQSDKGIKLLMGIGTMDKKAPGYRKVLQDIVTGGSNILTNKAASSPNQEEQQ